MNLVGKIFVMLIFVFSILFMGISIAVYQTHKNWRDVIFRAQPDPTDPVNKPIGLKFQLDEARKKLENLTAERNRLETELQTEKATRRQVLAKLESELTEVRRERDQLALQEADLRQKASDADANVRKLTQTLDARLAEIDQLRKDINDARVLRDEKFEQVVQLTDQLHQAQGELERLKLQNLMLAKQFAKARNVLMTHDLPLELPPDGQPPRLDGVVLASSANGLVEISLGSDDGLLKGHKLDVYRRRGGESKYLGRIEVLQVLPDKAVAKILPEYRKGTIEREDRVATRLD
jgi:multidrug efflux pump subunit AcrA (membrane-fusion protein)